MKSPAFTVIVPCYNRADTVLPTLESVRSQTFGAFECLVVDDGSSDVERLVSIVDGLHDPRFRLIRRTNGGGGAARNTGILAARAPYVAFLDSDDLFLSEKLREAHEVLSQSESGDQVIFSQILVDRGVGRFWVKPSRGPLHGERIDEYLILHGGFIQTSTLIVPTVMAQDVMFDELLPFGQDTDFCIRLAAHGAQFKMTGSALVVWKDTWSALRVSSNPKYLAMISWTERIRPVISRRSFFAYRGWHIAKAAKPHSLSVALRLYLSALLRGAFSPKLAIKVALQLLLPRSLYRSIADQVVSHLGGRAP